MIPSVGNICPIKLFEVPTYFGFNVFLIRGIYCTIRQLLDEAKYDMKNYADRGGCYPPKPKAEADNTL